MSSAPVVSRWLGPGNRTFLEVASMVVTWWIVAFVPSGYSNCMHLGHKSKMFVVYNMLVYVVTCTIMYPVTSMRKHSAKTNATQQTVILIRD